MQVFLTITAKYLCSGIRIDTGTHASDAMWFILPLLITGLNNTDALVSH